MKKTVKIVTIGFVADFCKPDDLVKVVQESAGLTPKTGTYFISHRYADSAYLKPHRLLILSDEVPATTPTEFIHNGKRIIASYPQLHNTLPVPKETVQAWIDAGCPNEGSIEEKREFKNFGVPDGDEDDGDCFGSSVYENVIQLDSSGNLLLTLANPK